MSTPLPYQWTQEQVHEISKLPPSVLQSTVMDAVLDFKGWTLSPWEPAHPSNGKSVMASVLKTLMTERPLQIGDRVQFTSPEAGKPKRIKAIITATAAQCVEVTREFGIVETVERQKVKLIQKHCTAN